MLRHFFLPDCFFLESAFRFCIFFCKLAYLLAGLRAVCCRLLTMSISVQHSNRLKITRIESIDQRLVGCRRPPECVMRNVAFYTWISLCLSGLVVVLTPTELLPDSLTPFTSAQGTFTGEAVEILIPASHQPTVKAEIILRMEDGACTVRSIGPGGLISVFEARDANYRDELPTNGQLILDPGPNSGAYKVFIGSKWHPLAPLGKLMVFLTCLVGLAVAVVKGQATAIAQRLGRKRFLFLIAISLVATSLYSVVHEFGHYSVGTLLGGKVDRVVWTPLAGEEARVYFDSIPLEARPWMSAGGMLVPTVLGLMIFGVRAVLLRRLSWYVSATMVVFSLSLLMGNLGCVFEMFQYNSHPNRHMNALATHFELEGAAMVLLVLSAPLLTLTVYALVGYKIYREIRNNEERLESANTTGI